MTDPMEVAGRLEDPRMDGPLNREAAACIREMASENEALKRRVERYRKQVEIERKAYRSLLSDYEKR